MAQSAHQKLAAAKAQLALLTTKIDELTLAAANEVDFTKVVVGSTVTFNYGKAPNVAAKTGSVVGVKEPAAGTKGATQVRVAVGEGFDAVLHTIYLPQITGIAAVEAEAPAEGEAAAS
jgi:hypothetical protein